MIKDEEILLQKLFHLILMREDIPVFCLLFKFYKLLRYKPQIDEVENETQRRIVVSQIEDCSE